MFLTYLGSMDGDDENQILNEEPDSKSGQRFYVAACPRLEGKHAKAQRFVVHKLCTEFAFAANSDVC